MTTATHIFDRRGKIMVKGGRYRVAQHIRHLRAIGWKAAARMALENAKSAYAAEMRREHERDVAWEAVIG